MSYDSFDPYYRGSTTPPWETARPQPAVVALAEKGRFAGRVLDVGCGTGENSLHLAALGHHVLGVDGSVTAVERARTKASERALPAEFTVADAFDLTALGQKFDTALDSAFLHIPGNTAERRAAYARELAAVSEPVDGSTCWSSVTPMPGTPASRARRSSPPSILTPGPTSRSARPATRSPTGRPRPGW